MLTYSAIVLPAGFPPQSGILRSDGAFVPADPLNADWQAYQVWLTAGNMPSERSKSFSATESDGAT